MPPKKKTTTKKSSTQKATPKKTSRTPVAKKTTTRKKTASKKTTSKTSTRKRSSANTRKKSVSKKVTPVQTTEKTTSKQSLFDPDISHLALALAFLSLVFTSVVALSVIAHNKYRRAKIYVNVPHQVIRQDINEKVNTSSQKKMSAVDKMLADINNHTGDKVLLTPSLFSTIVSVDSMLDCSFPTNNIEANAVVRYESDAYGIALDLPYNEQWGNNKYIIGPYWETQNAQTGITFGKVYRNIEGCGLLRDKNLLFIESRSAEAAIDSLQKEVIENEYEFVTEPIQISIGDLEAVYYQINDLRQSPELEIIGTRYNYSLSNGYGGTLEELIEIAETIELQ